MNESIALVLNGWAVSSTWASNIAIFCAVYLGYAVLVALVAYVFLGKNIRTDMQQILSIFVWALFALAITELIKHFFRVN